MALSTLVSALAPNAPTRPSVAPLNPSIVSVAAAAAQVGVAEHAGHGRAEADRPDAQRRTHRGEPADHVQAVEEQAGDVVVAARVVGDR